MKIEIEVPDDAHPMSLKFYESLGEMAKLHAKKQADYGRDDDPFANVSASEEFGIKPWIGCMVRANDKMRRLQAFAQKGVLLNESAEDSLIDLAVYSVIGLVLMRESKRKTAYAIAVARIAEGHNGSG